MAGIKKDKNLVSALEVFGYSADDEVKQISTGLINSTFEVISGGKRIILQRLNKNVFKTPREVVQNYSAIYSYLQNDGSFKIPAPVKTTDRNNCFTDESLNCWRANVFIEGSYNKELPQNSNEVFDVANCFGRFTNALSGFDLSKLKIIIPEFHNLSLRFNQLSEAMKSARIERILKAKSELNELLSRVRLVYFYSIITRHSEFKSRVMHHDAKISNILFDRNTHKVICPVDFDTVQPGLFYSDLGDMIRSMACTQPETSVEFSEIDVNADFYKAILDGYLLALQNEFTAEEINNIHYSGLLMIYMQALRYMTDYLNDDIYYKIEYPEQNFNRAKNQLTLLQKLELFLERNYKFSY